VRNETTGFTLWFTGLSGAGKSTIAEIVGPELERRGILVDHLDGDVVRTNLSKGLGFSREDRDANILRIGFVAKLLTRHGAGVIVAAISPYAETRDDRRPVRRGVRGDVARRVRPPRREGSVREGVLR
jgi:adenylylsulfate kinase